MSTVPATNEALEEAVVKAIEAVEARREAREEASRYEKSELARWAVEQAVSLRKAGTTQDANATTVIVIADALIKYVEDKRDA